MRLANTYSQSPFYRPGEDNCPTCGQLFPEEGRPEREKEINSQIRNAEKEKTAVLALSEKLKSASDIVLRMRTLTEQMELSSVCMHVSLYVCMYVCMYVGMLCIFEFTYVLI